MTPCIHRVHDDKTGRMGVTLVIRYEMNRAGRFVRMKREMPDFARLLSGLAEIH